MATKKSGKKSSSGKKSAAKKRPAKAGRKKHKRTDPDVSGNPPIILGGGGSIVIYSMMPLERPPDIPPLEGYPYVYVYPDRTKTPKHFSSRRKAPGGGPLWRKAFNPRYDLLEVQTD